MSLLHRSSRVACVAGLLFAFGCGDDTAPAGPSTGPGGSSSQGGDAAGGAGGSGANGTGGSGASTMGGCIDAEGPGTEGTGTWVDGADTATATIAEGAPCERTYTLSTTAPLRDGLPEQPRAIQELPGQTVIRTKNDMFDALYALAVSETRENSVDAISDGAFNQGQPIPCPTGGCFETGRLWTYVWTRDTSYSAALALAAVDPLRTKNSLLFKLSPRRDGSRPEIVQDTGSGGSYPVSSDRVVWALGAWELLKYLEGQERQSFLEQAAEAIFNTAERDRNVVYDGGDGLYRGEQSFLDWREQSYPGWVATDTVQIAMSKTLSTNVAHYVLLDVASKLAEELGDTSHQSQYAAWADALKAAIASSFWLEDRGLFSTFETTTLDPSAAPVFDLLGSALAVSEGVGTSEQRSSVVASYPHFEKGAPVIFPEQKDTAIYHNRAIWPFVSAFFLRAAGQVGNAAAVDHAVRSLVRGAAMATSNMEAFEVVSGASYWDDGAYSGPVVSSHRQLWSVAGYLSMVHDTIFGLDATQTRIRFAPRLTGGLRDSLFAGADSIAMSNFPYKGKTISVRVRLPAVGSGDGMLPIASVKLNGVEIGMSAIAPADLAQENVVEVTLDPPEGAGPPITLIQAGDVADYRNVFGPKYPVVTNVTVVADRLQVAFGANGENPADITFDVLRDGEVVAEGLPGSSTSYTDPDSGDHASTTHCYSVRSRFSVSGNASQDARPVCYWGPGLARIQTFSAQSFTAVGGQLVLNHGRWHYEDWGDPGDTLTVANVTPTKSGPHYIQVLAGNGAGSFNTGITCGVKAVEVWAGSTKVGGGQLVMPQLGTWDDWRDSNLVRVDLQAGQSYTIVIKEDADSGNMSDLSHFSMYEGMGGKNGRFNKVNIAEVKLLAL